MKYMYAISLRLCVYNNKIAHYIYFLSCQTRTITNHILLSPIRRITTRFYDEIRNFYSKFERNLLVFTCKFPGMHHFDSRKWKISNDEGPVHS